MKYLHLPAPLAFALVAFCAAISAAIASSTMASAQTRAVVELFTSQGCSSCPAADKVLGELAKDSSIVALSLPIDYWDYLGWKDTLANPRFSLRQRAYARARGDRQVYTPQAVVNGSVQVLGSDKNAIEHAIALSSRDGKSFPVEIAVIDGKLEVNLPEARTEKAEVWICGISKAVPVTVNRGENRGRTLTYYNVTRRWMKIGDWTGKAARLSVPMSEVNGEGTDSAAVIVQTGNAEKPGPIVGAALTPLP